MKMADNKTNMIYDLKSMQAEVLQIMKFIHKVCEDNGIQYSLTGGTLLGAIRHDGFIPWDDDLDIMMTRANYQKFVNFMKDYEKDDFLMEDDQWVSRVRKESRVYEYVPSVDIFVLDRVPKNAVVHKTQVFLLRIIQGMLRDNRKKGNHNLFYRACIAVTSFVGRFFNKEKLLRAYNRISQKGNIQDSKEWGIFNDRFVFLPMKYEDDFMDNLILHDFADTKFYVINGYHRYLTRHYGDYMQLPPEEERVPMHI